MLNQIKAILDRVQTKEISVEQALKKLKYLPFEDLGFAKTDLHRQLRKGHPEIIFGQGKTPEQIVDIFISLANFKQNVIATRISPEKVESILKILPDLKYFPMAQILYLENTPPEQKTSKIAVVSAGTADLPVAEEAAITLELFGHQAKRNYDIGVAGLHRLLSQIEELNTAQVIIVVAGMDGALPSVIGGLFAQPIIAVPVNTGYGANFEGIAPLLTMLNACAPGIGVVNIDNGLGAALLAHAIVNANLKQEE